MLLPIMMILMPLILHGALWRCHNEELSCQRLKTNLEVSVKGGPDLLMEAQPEDGKTLADANVLSG